MNEEDADDQTLLGRLFLDELEGLLVALAPEASLDEARRALH